MQFTDTLKLWSQKRNDV